MKGSETPKVFITGDVHQENQRFSDQKYSSLNEVESAKKYSDIISEHGLNATLFFAGKAVKQESRLVKEISEKEDIEIGGHTWNSFRWQLLHRFFRKTLGTYYGPQVYQKTDIKLTKIAIERYLNIVPTSWRTHAYRSDENTSKILENEGFSIISDQKLNGALEKISDSGIGSVPINIIPDHEHLIHADQKKQEMQDRDFSDEFGGELYEIGEYIEEVKAQIKNRIESGSHAVLLLHPMCMEAADGMEKFEDLCEFISENGYETEILKNIE